MQVEKSTVNVHPGRAHADEVVQIDAPGAIAKVKNVRVRFGDRDAMSIIVSSGRIFSIVPSAEPGQLELSLEFDDDGGKGRRLSCSFSHQGTRNPGGERTQATPSKPTKESRPPVEPGTGGAGAEKAAGAKPGDPTRPAGNWWMLHQALYHTAHAATARVAPFQQLWSHQFVGALSTSQPLLAGDKVLVGVLGNGQEVIAALERNTGAVLWTRNSSASVWGTPVAVNDHVYFVESSWAGGVGSHQLVCLRIDDGVEQWTTTLAEGSQSGMAAAFGSLYLLTRDGSLSARNVVDGGVVWEVSVDVGGGQTLSSPAVGFGTVFVGSQAGLAAFDASTGSPKAIASPGAYNGNSSPLIVSDVGVGNPPLVVICDGDSRVHAHNAMTGASVWSSSANRPLWYTTPCAAKDLVYVAQALHVVALDANTGAVTAQSADFAADPSAPPTVTEAELVVASRDSKMSALDPQSLSTVSTLDMPGVPNGDHGQPSIDDGQLFINTAQDATAYAPSDTLRAYAKRRLCVIVTVAYGSPLAEEVRLVQRVRDEIFASSPLGRRLLGVAEAVYYSFSPGVARAMVHHPRWRTALRVVVVAPLVRVLRIALVATQRWRRER